MVRRLVATLAIALSLLFSAYPAMAADVEETSGGGSGYTGGGGGGDQLTPSP